jgi:hypothetical protein
MNKHSTVIKIKNPTDPAYPHEMNSFPNQPASGMARQQRLKHRGDERDHDGDTNT